MKTIYFIRHGKTETQERNTKIYQGYGTNLLPLSKTGINQIETSAKDPRLKKAELILSSPYTRALQSAAIISQELNLKICVETDLHEWIANKYYQYENEDSADFLYQDFIKCNGKDLNEDKIWESSYHMKKRVLHVLQKYEQYNTILVVCHGMLIQAVTGQHHPNYGEIIELKKDS